MINDEYKKSIDDWADQYQDAIDKGVFKDRPLPKEKSGNSFFGLQQDVSDVPLNECDTRYWRLIANHGTLAFNEEDLSKSELADRASQIAQTPNPVQDYSVGTDQEMDDEQLGNTYTSEDIEEIEEIKKQIHDLEDKLNSEEGMGEDSDVQDKIDKLRDDLEDLSNALGRGPMDQQGD